MQSNFPHGLKPAGMWVRYKTVLAVLVDASVKCGLHQLIMAEVTGYNVQELPLSS